MRQQIVSPRVPDRSRRGFTIVELLIVVVVIAILAAITIVAYNGIQERARTSVINNAANNWIKLLNVQSELGYAPTPNTDTCLGRSAADFPAGDGFAAGECLQVIMNGTLSHSVSFMPDMFTSWNESSPRPDGRLPITMSTFKLGEETGVYRARGLFLSTYGLLVVSWVPVVVNECGPGRSYKAAYDELYEDTGIFSGDICQLDLRAL